MWSRSGARQSRLEGRAYTSHGDRGSQQFQRCSLGREVSLAAGHYQVTPGNRERPIYFDGAIISVKSYPVSLVTTRLLFYLPQLSLSRPSRP